MPQPEKFRSERPVPPSRFLRLRISLAFSFTGALATYSAHLLADLNILHNIWYEKFRQVRTIGWDSIVKETGVNCPVE